MRKITGLCILTATLFAGSAHAQSLFIDKGDPDAVSAMAGIGVVKNALGLSLRGGYSYRGVFDVGLDFTRYGYNAGPDKNLAGYNAMPFLSWHALRSDGEGMPISLSFTLGMGRIFYTGNGDYANPEGWELLLGSSVYRRLEFGSDLVLIPEVFLAYDLQYTRRYTVAETQKSGNLVDSSKGYGFSTDPAHGARLLVRFNLLLRAGNAKLLVVPYAGYQNALAAGANVGMLF